MTAWRKLVLVAGVVGVIAIFMPLFALRQGPIALQLSARELSFGLSRTHQLLDRKLPASLEKRLPGLENRLSPSLRGKVDDARGALDDARTVMDAARGAVLLFVPSALLVVLGVAGMKRRRFGRGLGAAALLCSLLSIAAFIALRAGLLYGLDEVGLKYLVVTFEIGAQLLLLVGIAGAIGGIGALVRPELGPELGSPLGSPSGPPLSSG
jgi:hypothetical protein